MKEWKLCGYCNEIALTLFKIEMVTQHCHPTVKGGEKLYQQGGAKLYH